jgi:NAD(P)-dependent dehydrogenase (short-subunit alcohol dehydrogenase family)
MTVPGLEAAVTTRSCRERSAPRRARSTKQAGNALPIACDVQHNEQVAEAVKRTVETFRGIDILVTFARIYGQLLYRR